MSFVVVAVPEEAEAGGVTMYADLAEDTNYNGGGVITPAIPSATTWPELATSASDDVFFTYKPDSDYATNDTMTLTFPSGYTVSTNCLTASGDTIDADGDDDNDGTAAVAGQVYTYTFSSSTTTGASNGVEFCVRVTAPATASNQAVKIYGTDADVEFGAALIYIGDKNDVTVTASVEVVLSFEIRNAADNGYTNSCSLGTLTTAAKASCDYRLKVRTNASDGYLVYFQTDGDLTKDGTPGDDADADDLDRITEDGTVTAGTEGYGMKFYGGSATVGTLHEEGIYDDDDTPLPTAADDEELLYSSSGANLPSSTDTTNTARVDHVAAIDSDTGAGEYVQIVSYMVIARF